jgi:hypothetical protein
MTIEHAVEQGTPEFWRVRLGIPTASAFDKILTPVKAELSKSSRQYAYRLIAEKLLNMPTTGEVETDWMNRGKEMEPNAANQYSFVEEVDLRPAGFFTTDDGLIGASPDRIVKGQPVAVEIKSPAPHTHVGYLLGASTDGYKCQSQGQLMVTEMDRVDLFSYHPMMPAATIRTHRDEVYISKLKDALDQFNAQLFEMLERAKSLGVFQAFDSALTPTDVERSEELNRQFREDFGLSSFGESS